MCKGPAGVVYTQWLSLWQKGSGDNRPGPNMQLSNRNKPEKPVFQLIFHSIQFWRIWSVGFFKFLAAYLHRAMWSQLCLPTTLPWKSLSWGEFYPQTDIDEQKCVGLAGDFSFPRPLVQSPFGKVSIFKMLALLLLSPPLPLYLPICCICKGANGRCCCVHRFEDVTLP